MHRLLPLALASVALAAPAPGFFKTPLNERSLTNEDGTVNAAALLASLNATVVKYGHPALPSLQRGGSQKRENLPLTDQNTQGADQLYYGSINIGKAAQKFTIDFDTGSADLFVPGPKCSSGCNGKTKYNEQGTDQKNTTTVTYGSGKISGENFADTVTVAGLAVDQQGFVSLTDAQGFSQSKADGLMGMGFSTIAQSKFPTFFEGLIAGKKVKANEFSFFLGRSKSQTQGQSELTLGGRDSSRFTGEPVSVPVTKKGYWQVALDGVTVNGKSAGADTKAQAAIDTGTTIVVAPTKAAKALYAQIPGAMPVPISSNGIQLYMFPCDTKATVALTFAGKDFALNALDFNIGSLGLGKENLLTMLGIDNEIARDPIKAAGTCIAGIGAADLKTSEPLYVVGDVFLKNWYSIYNYDGDASVLFAAAKGNQ